MQKIAMFCNPLFVRGQDIANDQAIELAVAQVVRQSQDDTLAVKLMNGLPKESADLDIGKGFWFGSLSSGSNHWLMGRVGARSQARMDARNSFSSASDMWRMDTKSTASSKYGSSSSRSCALRSKSSTSLSMGIGNFDIKTSGGENQRFRYPVNLSRALSTMKNQLERFRECQREFWSE